ncbi:MAG: SAM-dependent methyltransferase [Defluviitaleaceae bacterium]|nr:SAM-dependent methyltransferase [Defluviitaleaceae bacterium]
MTNTAKKEKKQTGSFYTQNKIAETMINWAVRTGDENILEPSFGDGIFIENAVSRCETLGNFQPKITAVEIKPNLLKFFSTVNTMFADFLSLNFASQFDVVIGNPPYIGIKNLSAEQHKNIDKIMQKYSMKTTKNASLWFPFVLQAIESLKIGGRLAFVLPFELTYVRYAFSLWDILANNFSHITVNRIYEDFFPAVDVETIIFFAENKGKTTKHVEYNIYDTINDFANNDPKICSKIPITEIIANEKPFVFQTLNQSQKTFLLTLKEQQIITPIFESCKFKIGYVSADKNYFHPNANLVVQYALSKENLFPAIINSKEINSDIGLEIDFGKCKSNLYVPKNITESDERYIKLGEQFGVHEKYKCRQRKPWYITPNIEFPDVILSVFGDTPKMIINAGKYAVSNSLLCGHLKNGSAKQFLCRWYNSLTLLSLELNVHSLGGGSFVIIPGEADKLDIVQNIPQNKVAKIFDELNKMVKNGDLKKAYELGDKLVLQDIFNFSDDDICVIRDAVKTLQNWRNPHNRRADFANRILHFN